MSEDTPFVRRWNRVLTTAQYVAGLSRIDSQLSDQERALLVTQYFAPERTVTNTQLGGLANIKGGGPRVNLLYGGLGRRFCEATGEQPDVRAEGPRKGTFRFWAVWSCGWRSAPRTFHWKMLPEVAAALEELEWVQPA